MPSARSFTFSQRGLLPFTSTVTILLTPGEKARHVGTAGQAGMGGERRHWLGRTPLKSGWDPLPPSSVPQTVSLHTALQRYSGKRAPWLNKFEKSCILSVCLSNNHGIL